jgi:hypothetical protein
MVVVTTTAAGGQLIERYSIITDKGDEGNDTTPYIDWPA